MLNATEGDEPARRYQDRRAEIDRMGDEIAELAANLAAATHALLVLIRRFDERGGWRVHGALSCAHWLSWRIGLDLGAAREKVRVAHALAKLPAIDEAFRRGKLSYSKVRALTRVATPENERELLDIACAATASQLERVCRKYRYAKLLAAPEKEDTLRDSLDRFVIRRDTEDGMVRVIAQLRPEEAAIVFKALSAAAARISAETHARVNPADSLMAIMESSLAGSPAEDAPLRAPVEVVLHVREQAADPQLAELEDGTPVSPDTARRLACDAGIVEMKEDARGKPLDVGRRTRSIPAALRRALRSRDGGCRFPGCDRRRFVDGHHIEHWMDGGATTLENLVELCRRHHRYVHEYGFSIRRAEDGSLTFHDPRGRPIPNVPPAPEARRPVQEINRDAGLAIDERTMPVWDGSPADYDWIIGVLMD